LIYITFSLFWSSVSPWHVTSSGSGLLVWPPDIEGSSKCIE